jgi:hypothetical protein
MVLLLLLYGSVWAQKEVTHQRQAWYGYYLNLITSDRSSIQFEAMERRFLKDWKNHQTLVRAHYHQAIGDAGWEFSAGGCMFFTRPNDPESSNRLAVPELRPHVEFAYRQQLTRFRIDHRYRAEARYFHNLNENRTELEEGYSFGNFRFRYRIQATFRLFRLNENRSVRFRINDELHVNAGSKVLINLFDQNRVNAAVAVDLSKGLSIDVGWMNWFQQVANGRFYNRQNFIVNIIQTLDISKKQD